MNEVRMSKKELSQITIFDAIVNKKMTQREASQLVRLSTRQIIRKANVIKSLALKVLFIKVAGKRAIEP